MIFDFRDNFYFYLVIARERDAILYGTGFDHGLLYRHRTYRTTILAMLYVVSRPTIVPFSVTQYGFSLLS